MYVYVHIYADVHIARIKPDILMQLNSLILDESSCSLFRVRIARIQNENVIAHASCARTYPYLINSIYIYIYNELMNVKW